MSAGEPRDAVDIAWAHRVNKQWIVHHGLRESAESYLNHLATVHPDRLAQSCENARRLVHQCEPGEDPKPWFYAGLFSLVTRDEARKFLPHHWFTASCIPTLDSESSLWSEPPSVQAETRTKFRRIRKAVAGLIKNS